MKRHKFVFACIKCLAALIIIAAPLSVGAQSKKDRERAKKMQEQADKAFRQKDFRTAADQYSQIVLLVPNNPAAHFWKAASYYNLWDVGEKELTKLENARRVETVSTKQKDLDAQIYQQKTRNTQSVEQALSEFTVALSQGFKPLEIYRFRAFIYYQQKNYDAAIQDVDKGLAIDPKDLQFLKGKGEINMDRKAFTAALDAFQKAAKVAPNDADVQYNMARAYFALGDAKAQGLAAETALAKGTRFPGESHYLLGDARQKQGNLQGAIESYQRAINSKPDIYLSYFNLAEVYRNENRYSDSIAALKNGLKTFPRDGKIYTTLSLYYSLADRYDDAFEAADAGKTLLPNDHGGYTALCRAQNLLKNYSEAVKACNTALDIEPNDGESNYYLGNAYVGLNKSVEATSKYTRAVKGLAEFTTRNPNSVDGWYLLGNASFADKQFDQAIDAYLKSLVISPKFLKARVNLGIVYTRKKNKAAALEQYNFVLPADASLAARLKAEIDKM